MLFAALFSYLRIDKPIKPNRMLTFIICLVLLVVAYFTYGRYLERVCKIDKNATVPSATLYDGVDYVPMPRWRTFLIQLLNIAGTGPIFWCYPRCLLWTCGFSLDYHWWYIYGCDARLFVGRDTCAQRWS